MIGLDTNVLLRYFMQDDTRQSSKAAALIETLSRSNQGFVSLVVIVELVWALNYAFQLERGEVRAMLKRLVNMPELKIEKAVHFLRALRLFEASSADFADCIIVCIADSLRCSQTVTFDRRAGKLPGAVYIG